MGSDEGWKKLSIHFFLKYKKANKAKDIKRIPLMIHGRCPKWSLSSVCSG
jgi:hypothetical protein